MIAGKATDGKKKRTEPASDRRRVRRACRRGNRRRGSRGAARLPPLPRRPLLVDVVRESKHATRVTSWLGDGGGDDGGGVYAFVCICRWRWRWGAGCGNWAVKTLAALHDLTCRCFTIKCCRFQYTFVYSVVFRTTIRPWSEFCSAYYQAGSWVCRLGAIQLLPSAQVPP